MNQLPNVQARRRRVLVPLLAGALLALPSGCGSGGGTIPGPPTNVQAARRLWTSRKPASYRYQLRLFMFAPPPVTTPVIVEVRNGVPVSVTPVTPGQSIDAATFSRYDTIEELLAVVEDAAARPADELNATFDSQSGYPKDVQIDYSRQMADEEIGFRVTDFEVL
jgi:hypothetical protein